MEWSESLNNATGGCHVELGTAGRVCVCLCVCVLEAHLYTWLCAVSHSYTCCVCVCVCVLSGFTSDTVWAEGLSSDPLTLCRGPLFALSQPHRDNEGPIISYH